MGHCSVLCVAAALCSVALARGAADDPLQKTSLCGGMTPVRSQWIKFGEDAIVLRVDTSRCAFEGTAGAKGPCYFASIVEAHHGTFIPGTVSLTQTGEKHFTLMMWDPSQASSVMLQHAADWLVSWVGAVGTRCGSTTAGATGWQLGEPVGDGAVAVYADVDTTVGGFVKTPTYLVSMNGLWDIESPKALLGVFTNVVHAPTPRGFRVYIVMAEAPGTFEAQQKLLAGGGGGGAGAKKKAVPKALQKAAEHADSYRWQVNWLGVEEDGATEMMDAARRPEARGSGEQPRWFTHGDGTGKGAAVWHDDPRFERDMAGEAAAARGGDASAAALRAATQHGAVFSHIDITAAHYPVIPAFVASVATARKAFACVGASVISAPTPKGFNLYLGRLTVRWGQYLGGAGRAMGCGVPSRESEDRAGLRVAFVAYRVAGQGDTAATAVAASGGGCAHVRLHGQPKGELMANRMGSYAKQQASYNSHPVYMMESARWGAAYLYFDFTPDGKTFWVVGPKVGSNAVNIYAVSNRHYPDRVEGQWLVADPTHNTFAPAPRIEVDCGLAVAPPRLGQCEDLLLKGQLPSFPMYHRMGLYTLQAEQYNGRPVYRNITQKWGAAYLYYDQTTDGKRFWVVGPKVGSSGVNLYAADTAAVPDRISVDWMVADPADNAFVASARIEATCQKNARHGFGDLDHFVGKMLRVDAELMAHNKESFTAAEGARLQRAVAAALGLPVADVHVAQTQEWRSKVVVEFHVNVRNPRVAEAAIAALSASTFATRVANSVGTSIGGAPLSGLQFSRPSLISDQGAGGVAGVSSGAVLMVVALFVVGVIVWTASKQKSRKSQLGRARKYRSLAGSAGGDAETAGLMSVNVEVKNLNAVDEESESDHQSGSQSPASRNKGRSAA